MISFLEGNWQYITYILISVISTVLVLVIKNKKTKNEMDLILLDVFERLPTYISQAEQLYGAGSGEEKKRFVLQTVDWYVKKRYSVALHDTQLLQVSEQIEVILKTPTKK